MEAIELGFSSIMFDGSLGAPSENLERTARMVEYAHARNISVEGEIGHVGEAITGDNETSDMYTTPREAIDFVRATGVDALAIAIGTAHGAYKTRPKLDIARLAEIRSAIETPLVLHGGSGLSDDDFRNVIKNGIAKVNIFTDLCLAGVSAMRDGIEDAYLDIRNRKVEYIKRAVMRKMELFGSVGKA